METNLNLTPNLLLEAKVKQNMCKLDIYFTFTPPLQKSKLSLLNKIGTKNK